MMKARDTNYYKKIIINAAQYHCDLSLADSPLLT